MRTHHFFPLSPCVAAKLGLYPFGWAADATRKECFLRSMTCPSKAPSTPQPGGKWLMSRLRSVVALGEEGVCPSLPAILGSLARGPDGCGGATVPVLGGPACGEDGTETGAGPWGLSRACLREPWEQTAPSSTTKPAGLRVGSSRPSICRSPGCVGTSREAAAGEEGVCSLSDCRSPGRAAVDADSRLCPSLRRSGRSQESSALSLTPGSSSFCFLFIFINLNV